MAPRATRMKGPAPENLCGEPVVLCAWIRKYDAAPQHLITFQGDDHLPMIDPENPARTNRIRVRIRWRLMRLGRCARTSSLGRLRAGTPQVERKATPGSRPALMLKFQVMMRHLVLTSPAIASTIRRCVRIPETWGDMLCSPCMPGAKRLKGGLADHGEPQRSQASSQSTSPGAGGERDGLRIYPGRKGTGRGDSHHESSKQTQRHEPSIGHRIA